MANNKMMSGVGDLNSLVAGALKSPAPSQPIQNIQEEKKPIEAAGAPSPALETGAQAIAAGGFAPLAPAFMPQAEEKALQVKAGELSAPAVAPSQATAEKAMKTTMALFGLPEEDLKNVTKYYNELLPNFEAKVKEARQLFQKKEEQLGEEQAKVAMFKILGHLALGIYGAQNGVDTSGIKFDTVDWAARHQKILNEYKMDTDLAESKFRAGVSRVERIEALAKMAMMQGKEAAKEEASLKEKQIATENQKVLMEYNLLLNKVKMGDRTEATNNKLAELEQRIKEQRAWSEKQAEAKAQAILEGKERAAEAATIKSFLSAKKPEEKIGFAAKVAAQIGAKDYDSWKESEGGMFGNRKEWFEYLNNKIAESEASKAPTTSPSTETPKAANVKEVVRKMADGREAVFDANTQKFLRYK